MECQSALDSCLQGADKHFEDCQEAHDHEADVPVHLDQSDPSVGSESENRDNAQVLPLTLQSLARDSFFSLLSALVLILLSLQNEAHEDASSSQDAQDETAPMEEKTTKAQKKKKKKKR